uniref:Uncharacterized protein n=1 Tax=Anguilla anguilla TaxID=7936 RepID=A0A0E9X7H0_ANGAN
MQLSRNSKTHYSRNRGIQKPHRHRTEQVAGKGERIQKDMKGGKNEQKIFFSSYLHKYLSLKESSLLWHSFWNKC